MSKGCGCQTSILRFIKPPYSKYFYVPCCIHDDDYDIGGKELEREIADVKLQANMLKVIERDKTLSLAKRKWLIFISKIYYLSVRFFGKHYFNYK